MSPETAFLPETARFPDRRAVPARFTSATCASDDELAITERSETLNSCGILADDAERCRERGHDLLAFTAADR